MLRQKRQKKLRKLSKAYEQSIKNKTSYAYCYNCSEFFIDDLPYSVLCPNGCRCLLDKGYKKPKV